MGKSQLNILISQLGLEDTVFFRDEENSYHFEFNLDIKKKLERIKPDAIFVFNNQPFVLFFDLTKKNQDYVNEIHKQVWSFDNSPVVFIIKNSDINVYNALNYNKKNKSLEEIKLSEIDRKEKFSFWNLQSGETWKWLQQVYFENSKNNESRKRVNERLFQNIKDVRIALIDEENDFSGSIPNSLILRLIFIRYLIDRGVKIDNEYISGNDLNARRKSFALLIKEPNKLEKLFCKLNDNFNGVLFAETDIQLNQYQAESLSQIFKGEIPEKGSLFYGGDYYFDIFDFSIIPVEIISGIYESLIDPETRDLHSAVYTPSFLVEYVLKDTVDKYLNENNTSECKIFEVAVGSGIFLVQSLRKMIEKEIDINGNKNKEKFSTKIREIVKNNLFGIDINKEALKVTCFSIYIALLDYQEPKDIEKYTFPVLLNENLFEANFFDTEHEFNNIIRQVTPNYLLGNPPWKSNKDICHLNWLKNKNKTVGNFEIAQSFLLRSFDFMTIYTKSALIVTSTIFYNVSKPTKKFKNEFLTTFCIDRFLDLSPVKQSLFEQQESPATIVFYHLSKDGDYKSNIIKHQSVKVNSFLKHFKMLVIEKNDNKEILQKNFVDFDWMFKVALYGNTLDFVFLKKLKEIDHKILDIIDNKNIFAGAGILKGNEKNQYNFLLGLPINKNNAINEYYTSNSTEIFEDKNNHLESGRNLKLFDGDKILFKEQAKDWSKLIISYNENPSIFLKGIFGITSNDKYKLKELYSLLISNLYEYYIFLISGSWGTSTRPQIRWIEEFLSFPYINLDDVTKDKLINLVDVFFSQFQHVQINSILGEQSYINKDILKKINSIVNELYNLKDFEIDLIDYVLNVSRYQFQESKQHLIVDFTYSDNNHYRNREKVLKSYAEVYINELNKIYKDEFIQIEIYPLKYFIAMNFIFLDTQPEEIIIFPKDKKDEEGVLMRLANNISISQITNTIDSSKNLYIQKDLKGFEDNSFYIIKPNEYKCWHKAMAWYDIAEFKETIEEAELNHLNENING